MTDSAGAERPRYSGRIVMTIIAVIVIALGALIYWFAKG